LYRRQTLDEDKRVKAEEFIKRWDTFRDLRYQTVSEYNDALNRSSRALKVAKLATAFRLVKNWYELFKMNKSMRLVS